MDIADLDSDGKKEIVVATSSGLIVALDHQCRKLWAKRLPEAATVMKCVTSNMVIGCEDGAVVVLDGKGEMIRSDRINGRPTCINTIGSLVLLATSKVEIKALKLE